MTAEGFEHADKNKDLSEDMSDEQILEALQVAHESFDDQRTQKPEIAPPRSRITSKGIGESRTKNSNSSGVITVKMPASVQTHIVDQRVLFLQSCELGDVEEINSLMVKCDNVRFEDDKGEMPLHKVARQGLICQFRAILDKSGVAQRSSDLDWQDKQGKTPIFYAIEYGHGNLVTECLDLGCNIEVESIVGWTVLHAAVNSNKPEMLSLILNHPKADAKRILDRQDKSKRTALHVAAFKSQTELVEILINKGADITLIDIAGLKPVGLAEKAGRRRSKELLEASTPAAI